MRVLVLNQYFHPDLASTSQLLTELCEDLSRGDEVTVVCGRPSYDPIERRDARGLVAEDRHGDVRVLRTWSTSFPRRSMAGRLANYGTYVASSLAGAMRAGRPDVVLAMTDPPVIAAAAALTARLRDVPFVYVVQDLFPQVGAELGKIRNRTLIRSLEALNRSLRRRASAVVAIGRDMAARLRALEVPERKLRIIPNWCDGSIVRPLDGPSKLRSELNLDDRFVVMHSGNVGFSQELDTLLDAATALRDDPEIHFLIVGDGAARPSLETKARARGLANVTFLGYRSKDELSDALGAADLHVVGLRRGLEGLIVPSKMYGVMAAGKPFIASVDRRSEVALVVEETGCGIRLEPGDATQLASAIAELRHDEGRLAEMGRRGRSRLESEFERTRATGAYRDLLQSLVRGRGGSLEASIDSPAAG
jgi:putative colanic acid biosynthesis glycosyltransferase WcaI